MIQRIKEVLCEEHPKAQETDQEEVKSERLRAGRAANALCRMNTGDVKERTQTTS